MDGYVKLLDSRKAYRNWVNRSYKKRDDLIYENTPCNARVLNYGCGHDKLSHLTEKSCDIVNFDIDNTNQDADYNNFGKIPGHFIIDFLLYNCSIAIMRFSSSNSANNFFFKSYQ